MAGKTYVSPPTNYNPGYPYQNYYPNYQGEPVGSPYTTTGVPQGQPYVPDAALANTNGQGMSGSEMKPDFSQMMGLMGTSYVPMAEITQDAIGAVDANTATEIIIKRLLAAGITPTKETMAKQFTLAPAEKLKYWQAFEQSLAPTPVVATPTPVGTPPKVAQSYDATMNPGAKTTAPAGSTEKGATNYKTPSTVNSADVFNMLQGSPAMTASGMNNITPALAGAIVPTVLNAVAGKPASNPSVGATGPMPTAAQNASAVAQPNYVGPTPTAVNDGSDAYAGAPTLDPRYHAISAYKPKVETMADGTKIVTIEGSYLNDMMKNMYKAGASSSQAKVEISPPAAANGNPMGQVATATAGLTTPPDTSRQNSPTGRQQISAMSYNDSTTNGILSQLRKDPANSKMTTADIMTALSRK